MQPMLLDRHLQTLWQDQQVQKLWNEPMQAMSLSDPICNNLVMPILPVISEGRHCLWHLPEGSRWAHSALQHLWLKYIMFHHLQRVQEHSVQSQLQ